MDRNPGGGWKHYFNKVCLVYLPSISFSSHCLTVSWVVSPNTNNERKKRNHNREGRKSREDFDIMDK